MNVLVKLKIGVREIEHGKAKDWCEGNCTFQTVQYL